MTCSLVFLNEINLNFCKSSRQSTSSLKITKASREVVQRRSMSLNICDDEKRSTFVSRRKFQKEASAKTVANEAILKGLLSTLTGSLRPFKHT